MSAADPNLDVVDLLRSLRLPHMRKCAPDLLATAKAQRWEPAEAVRALLVEELTGRQRSSIASRRKAAGFPTGKTFEAGLSQSASSSGSETESRTRRPSLGSGLRMTRPRSSSPVTMGPLPAG
jgi:hypothetical protein